MSDSTGANRTANAPPANGQAVSVVVPLLNEAPTIAELHRRLKAVAAREGYALQVVFVDDGSTDDSWKVIGGLANAEPGVVGVRFRRNFGKADALDAGFAAATAPIVVTMDADLQDDPDEIPTLLAKLAEGYDVVSGWKVDRKDPWHKRWPSLVFNSLASRLTFVRLHDHNCGLKAYRREALADVTLYGELHRFVPVLAAARGYRVTEVPVKHHPREHGVSKYGASRIVKGLMDLITVKFLTGYGDRPQHVLGGLGLVSFAAGSLGLFYLAIRWIVTRAVEGLEPIHLHETAALYYCLAMCLVGAQFLAVGLLGAMITASLSRDRPSYSIAETIVASPSTTKER
ncbi:Undecaprenyl-phosphate 4-deoxy-4-formamido-L-arabinose transferase [Botrimarina colliarenosi]|uniref:Undecaprenyl-phosphate 4-deoxy-4-formamido-L-arabinose transferase n=1 Tax=Botrimarina colliarenosi TaxID=2528001 RepID=A0A5C6AFC9_9BACT|nr:glycosyltransferase family 2 protein [Botrimarina colliarenosi]TWT98136.1 Undecaprenyl-phosphate 4-deoxy-4-formamido-L-arabinose transferase [Botrimarina colliarenosi]